MRLFKFTFIFLTQSDLGRVFYLNLHVQALIQIFRNVVDVLEEKQNIASGKIKIINLLIFAFSTDGFIFTIVDFLLQ